MQHGITGQPNQVQRQAAEPAHVDVNATEKLRMLAAELLRDSVVAARIRADSTLRPGRENESVRRDTSRTPR